MASIPCTLLVLLIFLSHDHMGVQGKTPTVFSSLGRDATLLCSNVVYPNCSSTTWLYTSPKAAVEVATHGKINPDVATHRAKRLSLISGCSLHITDVTTEDAVIYTCLQYLKEGGPKNGEDAPVYLSVLQVSASPSETEMKADSHVTLHCLLHTPDHCGVSVADKGVSLSWVDEGGKELQNNNNLKIGTKPPCSITRTEELRGPNSVHTQTCQLTAGGQIQTSVSHIIRVKGVITSTSSASVLKSSPRMENVTTASSNSTSGPSGVRGGTPTVFSSVGGDATLLCSGVVYPGCSSTTWLNSSSGSAVEVVFHGRIKPDVATHRAKGLSLVSDCSLHITDVSTDDAGLYTCQQYLREGGPKHGEDAPVYLSVFQGVVPTTSSTSVLKSSPRMKTLTPASSYSTSSPSVSLVVPLVAGVVVSVSLLAAALMIIVVICKRRTNAGGEPTHKSTQSRTIAIVMQSVQSPNSSANEEEGADLHYATFQHVNPTQAGPSAKQSEDTVTYSTIMQLSGGKDHTS